MRRKKKKHYCGNHVFYAWILSNGVTRAIRKCVKCDYEQGRGEYFKNRELKIESMRMDREIANKYGHIDLFV